MHCCMYLCYTHKQYGGREFDPPKLTYFPQCVIFFHSRF